MWLIGLTARIYRPGCKFDYMTILEGLQGTLKSQVCVALCGPWVSDQSLDIRHDARAASQHLRNKWLIEVSELVFFRQADVETLKAFITRTYERYLPRFAHNEVIEPRQCGFVGTTNQDAYLHDPTGNRRFWPHRTGKIDIRALMRDRDQLWAEVVAAYRKGEHWWPEEDFETRVIQPEQAGRYDADAWLEPISTTLDQIRKPKQAMRARGEREPNGTPPRARTTLLQVWQAAMNSITTAYTGSEATTLKFDRSAQIRTREILQFLGWRRGKLHDGRAQWEEPL
jgi:predicted P-loop ATPase